MDPTSFNARVRNIVCTLGYCGNNYDFYATPTGIMIVGYESPEIRAIAATLAVYPDKDDSLPIIVKTEAPDG